MSSKGRIVLPAELRQRDGIQPGQEFDVKRLDRVDYRLVNWLLACPQKGYFVAVESETTA